MKTLALSHKRQRYDMLLFIGFLLFTTSSSRVSCPPFLQENEEPCLINCVDMALLEQYQVDDVLLVQYLQEIQYEVEQIEQLLVQQVKSFRQQLTLLYRVIFVGCAIIALLAYIYFLERQKTQSQRHIVQQYETYLQHKKEARKENDSAKMSCTLTKLVEDLQHLFETEKTYRQQGLSVDDVVQKLQTNSKYLSNAINQHFHKNFTEFVNTYRVEEAIEILKDQNEGGEYAHYTIQAIAEAVGFNGRTAFYAAFKKLVGLTPTEYMGVINQQKEVKKG